ncbi:MAG: divalent-cation tolerance protein CutA [Rickettsiaceae bacterium]|nr:divalent-cation tolerance protein CutA [Rickettsiaceae bacterium]
MKACLVITTTATHEDAIALAGKILEAKLAACIQLDNIKSIYRWNEEIVNEQEVRLSIKTLKSQYADLKKFILANHKYTTPEIIQIDMLDVEEKYLNWLRS